MYASRRVANRYDPFSRLLHWVVAAVIIYAMCMGYILHALEGTRWFHFFSVLNMSLGTMATPHYAGALYLALLSPVSALPG